MWNSCSARIHESILISSFRRHLRRSVKFLQRRKKLVVHSNSKLQEYSGFIVSWKLWLNVCFLRKLKPKRNLARSLRLSETLNKLLGVVLRNFSDEFEKPHTILIYEFADLSYFIPWLCTERRVSQNILLCLAYVEICHGFYFDRID